MANHYLALPFLRPFLSESGSSLLASTDTSVCDLLDVLARIRTLQYTSRSEFLSDLGVLHTRAAKISHNSPEIMQAYSTLLLSANQVVTQNSARLKGIEKIIHSQETLGAVPPLLQLQGRPVGLEGHLVAVRLPDVSTTRSIQMWEKYVRESPVGRRGDDLVPLAVGALGDPHNAPVNFCIATTVGLYDSHLKEGMC